MTDDSSTITQLLAWATGELRATSRTPRLDAELLLAHILGWRRARLLAEGRQPLTGAQGAAFRALVARRVALEPVAYLTGRKEFYGLDLVVDRRVLVPRPETELLVDLAIAFARRLTAGQGDKETRRQGDRPIHDCPISPSPLLPLSRSGQSSPVIADIGTGSGAIAVALAVHLPQARIVATDISRDALEVARQNVQRHGVAGRVRLVLGDLLEPLDEPVALLVSNPPYTILTEIDEGVRRHEPLGALDGGPDGLDVYRRLLAQAPAKLLPAASVLLEIGATQAAAVSALARRSFPEASMTVHQDLAGLDRVVAIDNHMSG